MEAGDTTTLSGDDPGPCNGAMTKRRVEPAALAIARDHLARVAEGWGAALLRLKRHVEES